MTHAAIVTRSAHIVRVRKPNPGMLVLELPIDLTTRPDGLDLPYYQPLLLEPDFDSPLLVQLASSIRKASRGLAGITAEGKHLSVYRSVGKMPVPIKTPRGVSDYQLLRTIRSAANEASQMSLEFVHGPKRRRVILGNHSKSLKLTK